jgi:hypothetical protein
VQVEVGVIGPPRNGEAERGFDDVLPERGHQPRDPVDAVDQHLPLGRAIQPVDDHDGRAERGVAFHVLGERVARAHICTVGRCHPADGSVADPARTGPFVPGAPPQVPCSRRALRREGGAQGRRGRPGRRPGRPAARGGRGHRRAWPPAAAGGEGGHQEDDDAHGGGRLGGEPRVRVAWAGAGPARARPDTGRGSRSCGCSGWTSHGPRRISAQPAGDAPAAERFRLFDEVTSLLLAESRIQLLLLLDDLQWADQPSQLLLNFLARRLAAGSVAVVGSYRDTEPVPGPAPGPVLAALAARTTVLPLTGLGPDAVGDLVAEVVGEQRAAEVAVGLHRRTGGNPFFVQQVSWLLRSGQEGIPPGVHEAWNCGSPPCPAPRPPRCGRPPSSASGSLRTWSPWCPACRSPAASRTRTCSSAHWPARSRYASSCHRALWCASSAWAGSPGWRSARPGRSGLGSTPRLSPAGSRKLPGVPLRTELVSFSIIF